MKILALLAILAALIQPMNAAAAAPAPQAELRVCASGCPYTIIQDAIDAAEPGDSIQIAAGTYSDMNSLGGLSQIAYITRSLTLRGGYSPDFSTWDPAAYITTLDAASAGRAVFASGQAELTLAGLHLTNGNATGLGGDSLYDEDAGGAVYVNGGVVTITDCTVENSIASQSSQPGNYAAHGGGVYIASSPSVTLTHNLIRNNIAATVAGDYMGLGGGILIFYSTSLLEDNTITGNIATTLSAGQGGGLNVFGGTAVLNNNTITFNTASQSQADSYSAGEGGGIFAGYPVTMTGNLIADNTAGYSHGNGGGLYLMGAAVLTDNQILRNTGVDPASQYPTSYGGGLYLFDGDSALITGNLFEDNLAGERGGAIYLDEGAPTFSENIIRGNYASIKGLGMGGGLYLADAPAHLINNQIIENVGSAGHQGFGGGLYLENSNATLTGNLISGNRGSVGREYGEGRGGGLAIVNGSPQLVANQITDNVAANAYYDTGFGGGVYLESTGATLTRNLVSGNTASSIDNGYGGGIYTKGWHGAAPVLDGNVIINNTASFHSLANEGFGGGVAIYRLGETVPVILRNNVIANNDSDDFGSGLWVGGAYETQPVGVLLEHNTIANNQSGDAAISLQYALTLQMTNNIISGHNLGVFAMENGTVTMDGTLWHQNTVDTGGAGSITHTNDLTGDPRYADASNFNYHLTAGSAARDAALASSIGSDLDGQTRPNPDTSLPDLGADEFYVTPPAAVAITGPDTVYLGLSVAF
ncbi:MAG TPA: hypothetical protein PKG95_10475, partial [Anaerolineaceae bacterium]|nr:hypothetical protein [Anaerolineaceae bacterium]